MSARALHVYEDWRARFAAGRPCPGLAALQRRGLLEALRAAGPGPTAAQTPARAVAPAAAPGPRRAAPRLSARSPPCCAACPLRTARGPRRRTDLDSTRLDST